MNISIDKQLPIAVHKQIYSQIVLEVENGNLKNREKLIPERELADVLKISRGTVKKAYETLINNGYATAEQGCGTFIISLKNKNLFDENDKKRSDIDFLIDKLLDNGFDFNEIDSMFKMCLLNKKNAYKNVNVAAIDCNPETLKIVKNRISTIKNVNYMVFLLKDVLVSKNLEEVFKNFDVIFTTDTHYKELCKCLGVLKNKVIKAVMSVDRETIIKFTAIKNPKNTGIITETPRFAEIIKNNLEDMKINIPYENYMLIDDLSLESFDSYIKSKETLILPPLNAMDISEKLSAKIFDFSHGGGEVIAFNYNIERGSIIYIEERILTSLNKI